MAELLFGLADPEARETKVPPEKRLCLCPSAPPCHLPPRRQKHPANSALDNENLLAVQHPMIAVQNSAHAHRRRVGTRNGLGQRKPARTKTHRCTGAGCISALSSSVPTAWITSATMLVTDVVTPVEAHARPISVMTREKDTVSAPVPPYLGSMVDPHETQSRKLL